MVLRPADTSLRGRSSRRVAASPLAELAPSRAPGSRTESEIEACHLVPDVVIRKRRRRSVGCKGNISRSRSGGRARYRGHRVVSNGGRSLPERVELGPACDPWPATSSNAFDRALPWPRTPHRPKLALVLACFGPTARQSLALHVVRPPVTPRHRRRCLLSHPSPARRRWHGYGV